MSLGGFTEALPKPLSVVRGSASGFAAPAPLQLADKSALNGNYVLFDEELASRFSTAPKGVIRIRQVS